jgi:hypothetical protein
MDILKLMPEPQKKTRGESRLKQQQRRKAAGVPEQEILEVYEHWISVMRPGKKRVPALDEKRRLKVASAIYDYGVEDCKLAIDGCARSDFHMGRNKQKKRYDDLELILRDQDHIERFLAFMPQHDEEVDW